MSSLDIDVQEARAHSVTVSGDALSVDLVDGRTVTVPLVWFPRLWHGSKEERQKFEIFGDGAYIHWPGLDEDLTVAGLLEGKRSGESAISLKKWLASRKQTTRKPVRRPGPTSPAMNLSAQLARNARSARGYRQALAPEPSSPRTDVSDHCFSSDPS